jgi:hypothetical protein
MVSDISSCSTVLPPALWALTGSNNVGIIRIAPQALHTPIKRKHRWHQTPDPYSKSLISSSPELPAKKWRPKAFEQEASSELEVIEQRPKIVAKKKPKRRHRSPKIRDTSHASPKCLGRPRKVWAEPHSCDFSTHVYVEITNPPKHHQGKSRRTNKYVLQDPTTEGLFTFTHNMDCWTILHPQLLQPLGDINNHTLQIR